MGNSLGKKFVITSFGESHGRCVGIVIDGCPAGLAITEKDIQTELDKRRASLVIWSTKRAEEDKVDILSGIFNGYTTGAPICLAVWNKDANSGDYEKMQGLLRPGHADYTAFIKYGGFNDHRGGGRFSGRNTAGFVMAGVIAQKLLNSIGVIIHTHILEIGGIKPDTKAIEFKQFSLTDTYVSKKMIAAMAQAQKAGDSLGGIIESIALNVPAGLGEPVFDTMEGQLAKALFAIPAVKGVEFGAGFGTARMKGSENNDAFRVKLGKIVTESNNSGGVLGGISNGMPLEVKVAVKPTPSISRKQRTVDIRTMQKAELEIKGRHDVCIVPRAVPVVAAMMAITLCDFALQARVIPEVIK
jgi:chorismate synthase